MGERVPGPAANGCGLNTDDDERCTFGDADAKKVMYLLGDSTSIAYADTFVQLVNTDPRWKKWQIRAAGVAGCPFADVVLNDVVEGEADRAEDCLALQNAIVDEINRVRPDVVVLTNGRADPDYVEHTSIQLAKIKDAAKKFVMLQAPPRAKDPSHLLHPDRAAPSDCVVGRDERVLRLARAPGTTSPPPSTGWSSTRRTGTASQAYCPSFVGDIPTHQDIVHMTSMYAVHIAPTVAEVFAAEKIVK